MASIPGPGDVGALIELVNDPTEQVREPALRALVHLPLNPQAWHLVGSQVLDLLNRLETESTPRQAGSQPLDPEALLDCAARVPVRQVRERVRALAVSGNIEIRRAAARALAEVQDPAAVPQLLDDLEGSDAQARSAAIEHLVLVNPAAVNWAARMRLARVARRTPSPETAFNAALTLARAGRPRQLVRLLELMRKRGSIFQGAPPDVAYLKALGPLPPKVTERISRFAEERAPHDLARAIAESMLEPRAKPEPPIETPTPEPVPQAEAAEAERLVNAYLQSDMNEEWIDRLMADTNILAWARPAVAENLVTTIFQRAAEAKDDDSMVAYNAAGAATELVARLKTGIQPDLKSFFEIYKKVRATSHDNAARVAWTVSRAHPVKVLTELQVILPTTPTEDRAALANLVEDAVQYFSTSQPPALGSGGESRELPGEVEFVADEPHEESAPPSSDGVSQGERQKPPAPPGPPGEGELDEPDPPRRSYALLDCPEAVVCGQEFELEVGLSKRPAPGVVGGELERPPTSVGPYELAVHVLADGFTLRQGESRRLVLPVTADAPYPVETLHLTPDPQDEPIKPRSISATYSIDGQTLGMGFRAVVVVRDATLLAQAPVDEQERGVDIKAPVNQPPADLTLNIRLSESKYWVTLENAHDLPVPEEPHELGIGDARDFARQLVDSVNASEGKPKSYRHLLGKARVIADQLPPSFWKLLRVVTRLAANEGGRPPSVLILSAEPFVPWELAAMEEPLDPSVPPFLAAQVEVGRWILARGFSASPPVRHRVESMSVVSGRYNDPGWSRLEHAEEEAKNLKTTYGAQPVEAKLDLVIGAIEGEPKADLLHMAIHGKYDPGGSQNGLVLTDGTLDPDTLRGSTMHRPMFVFLNACQVGSGNEVLSDYGGVAAALLRLGATAVIAPLWSIKDEHAQQIALNLYSAIHDPLQPHRPAALLRLERQKFKDADPPVSSTFLAYQYFGHPALELESRLTKEE